MNNLIILGLFNGLIATSNAERESYLPDFDDGVISFYLDNDIFRGTDEGYTSGGRLAWISGNRDNLDKVSPIQRSLNKVSGAEESGSLLSKFWGFDNNSNLSFQYGTALTQQIFTPETFQGERPLDERPYAGWLGLGFSLHVSDEKAINSVELNIGTVGPNAFAQETQDFVHEVVDAELFEDWDSQIPNELTINIDFVQRRRHNYVHEGDFPFLPISINGFTEKGISIGNQHTGAHVGWLTQIGYNVPIDFSDPRLSRTANTVSYLSDSAKEKFSIYLIGGVRARYVAHDITIDGPLFRDFETNAESEPFQLEYFYGIGGRYKNLELGYINFSRTREFENQDSIQNFGSVYARIHF